MADDIVQSLVDVIPAHLHKDLERELINGWRMNEAVAKANATKMAHFNHTHEANNIEGFGRKVANIPDDAFHYWGHRLGYDCWKDKEFMREFLRDNPECAVRNYVKKTVVNGSVFGADGFLV